VARTAQGSAGWLAPELEHGGFGREFICESASGTGTFAVRDFDRTFDLQHTRFSTHGSGVCGGSTVGCGSAELGCCERGRIGGDARDFIKHDLFFHFFHAGAREGKRNSEASRDRRLFETIFDFDFDLDAGWGRDRAFQTGSQAGAEFGGCYTEKCSRAGTGVERRTCSFAIVVRGQQIYCRSASCSCGGGRSRVPATLVILPFDSTFHSFMSQGCHFLQSQLPLHLELSPVSQCALFCNIPATPRLRIS